MLWLRGAEEEIKISLCIFRDLASILLEQIQLKGQTMSHENQGFLNYFLNKKNLDINYKNHEETYEGH